MKKVVWPLLVTVVIALAVWWWRGSPAGVMSPRARPPVPVTVESVQVQAFADQVSALGTLRAWESVDISATIAQKITELHFDDGQRVAQGDVLALLKQDGEQAMLQELQASQQDARREVGRLENLAKKNQVAQNELDKARTLVAVTGHRIEEVQARISDRTIIAPFSGVLGLRQVSEGALVTPGQRLTTLDDLSQLRLEFNVPAIQLGLLKPGQAVAARTPALDRVFEGEITAIDSRVDPVSRSITARARLDNPDGLLRPGLLMEVVLTGNARQALLVPEESLQSRASSHFLWKLDGDTARRVPVKIGGRIPGRVEVTEGLEPGDKVVRDGVGMLSGDAAAVIVVED